MISFNSWGLGGVLETGAEDPGIGFIGHGSAGNVPQSPVEVGGDVVGGEPGEHEPHEGLGIGLADFQDLFEFFGGVVVFLRHVIRQRDSNVHHSFIFWGWFCVG